MERLIADIKSDFVSELSFRNKEAKDVVKLRGQVVKLATEINNRKTFREKINPKLIKDLELVTKKRDEAELKIKEIENNKIFENAFEWRFEFPEVLNDEGDFVGFDVVIGNPPYFSLSKVKEQSEYFSRANYVTYSKGADIFCLFYELGGNTLKPLGFLTYITSNSWLRAIYGELLKKYFIEKLQPIALMNIEDVQIFEEATVESNIITLQKSVHSRPFQVANLSKDYSIGDSLNDYFTKYSFEFIAPSTSEWFVGNQSVGTLKSKIENGARPLKDFNVRINFGIKTDFNEAFIIDENKRSELIRVDKKNAEIIKPIIRGRDLKKYSYAFENIYLINSHNGIKSIGLKRIETETEYPTIYKHLKSFSPKVENRSDMGDHWSNLRNCAYLEDFEKDKIIWGEISDKPKFAFDVKSILRKQLLS